ncbi:MAG: ATP-binding protein [Pseudomonadota bacterium]
MANATPDNAFLTAAFEAFSAHSLDLDRAYGALETRVHELTDELKEARAARHRQLSERERVADRLAHLLEALPHAVLVTDAKNMIVDANVPALSWFAESLIGTDWRHLERRLYGRNGLHAGDVRLADGRLVSATRSGLRDGGNMLVFSDVTEARAAHATNERQERLAMLGEMAARLAHQIRTPLTSALLYATRPTITDIHNTRIAARLHDIEAMVEDLLRFARGTPPDEERLDSQSLLLEVAETARETLPDHIGLIFDSNARGFALRANRQALSGALHNLITNAAQHCGSDGRITLRGVLAEDGQVQLQVEDNGAGITPAVRDQIFEPFFTTRAEGTGLGLAVVRSVARAHHGDVIYQPTTQGSRFAICMPLSSAGSEGIPSAGGAAHFAISASVPPAHSDRSVAYG